VRFAVRRPGIPEASPRSHGVPRRDVPGRVHVSVAGETAGQAYEARLALARLRVCMAARRAPLTCEMRLDPYHSARRLVLQSTHQQSPARPKDPAVQPGFLANIPAGGFLRTFRRSGHVLDPEVFDPDQVEPASQIGAGLLGPVLAPVGLASTQPGNAEPNLVAAIRAAPGAREFPLQAPQSRLLGRGQARYLQQFARRQGGGYGNSPVNTHNLVVARAGNRVGNHSEGDVPASCTIQSDPVGLHPWRHWARPAKSDPADLRHPDFARLPAEPAHMLGLNSYDSESLIPSGLPPRWPSGRVVRVQERGHRLREVTQGLLLHHLGARRQPWMLGAGCGELSALLQIARCARPAGTPMRVLLDREIPYITCVSAVVPEHRLLGGRRAQPIPGHTNTLSDSTDIRREVKRRFLPDGASTSRSR
jgi:hypothetical protein